MSRKVCLLVVASAVLFVCSPIHAYSYSVTPSSLSFGSRVVGTTTELAVAVYTGQNITISRAYVTGPAVFQVKGRFPAFVNAGQTLHIPVYFTPTAVSSYRGTLTIQTSTGATTSLTVSASGITSSAISVTISPTSATVQTGHTQQFSATLRGTTNTGVLWSVNGVQGGNSTVGTISTTGLYTAPVTPPSAAVTVTATSVYDTAYSARATVKVAAATSTVSVAVSPAQATLAPSATQQFTAYVTGTTNTGMTWSVAGINGGNSTVGTITSTGLYTAPQTPPANPVTVAAASAYDPTKSASATVTVTGGATPNEYWVSTLGSDSNPGTQSQPWATISHADSALQLSTGGAVVHVAPGTYNHCIVTSKKGTATQRIKYLSDTRYGARLTCTASVGGSGNTIWHSHGSFTDIVGFDIDGQDVRGQSRIGVYFNADSSSNPTGHNRLLGNKIHGLEACSSSASATGSTEFEELSPYNTYDGNVFFDIGNTCQLQGFSVGVTGEGIYISNPYDVVTNNIMYHISYDGSSAGSAVFANHGGVSHDTIANNLMFENGNGVTIDWGPPAVSSPYTSTKADYMVVANNIIVDNLSWGIVEMDYGCVYGTCGGIIGPNNYYFNNLVHGNTGNRGGKTGVCSQVGDTKYNVVIFNGHCATGSIANMDPASGTIFANWQLNGSGDYDLASGSPAINAGAATGPNSFNPPGIDHDGAFRDSPPDVGPYEYGATPATWPWY